MHIPFTDSRAVTEGSRGSLLRLGKDELQGVKVGLRPQEGGGGEGDTAFVRQKAPKKCAYICFYSYGRQLLQRFEWRVLEGLP